MNVLSLFDGMSCGQIALKELNIKVDKYYASEIDKYAIQVTQKNYPNTIQLGDVTKVKVKLLCLSEVYSYICSYDSNLQSNISEWEVLYWLNKDFTLSAKIRTQKPNERQEVSEPSTVQRIKEVWFSNREMGSVRKFGDYTRSGRDGEENDIRTPQQLQCGKWWYDNDIYRRYKEENIGITIGKTKNGDSEKKNFGNIEGEVFKRRESESCFRENEKSNVEKRCSGELFERKREDRFSREVEKEKGNRRTKEGNFIDEVIRELCRWDESNGITQDYWSLLRLHKEEQITVVEYEEGFYFFKGRIDLCIGGSPCQSFSFAGKRNGMSTTDNVEIYTLEKYLKLKEQGFEFEGQSYLFWEYMRILTDIRKYNPNVLFLLENVEMGTKWERVLSEAIGIYGVHINSALVSAQNRKRIYWTNIRTRPEGFFGDLHSDIPQPADRGILLKDILEDNVDEKYYLSEKMLNYFDKRADNFNNGKVNIRAKNDKSTTITASCKSVDISDNFILDTPDKSFCIDANYSKGASVEQYINKHRRQLVSISKEIVGCDYRSDEGIRYRPNSKSGTLQVGERNNESCGQLVSVTENYIQWDGTGFDQDNRSYYEDGKSGTLDLKSKTRKKVLLQNRIRRLTPTECARLQTIPCWYKWNVSDTQQYKLLGNGWTVEVIKHIFSFIK